MIKLYEKTKVDTALTPQALATSNATGPYFDMQGYDSALFILTAAAMASGKTAKIEIMGNSVAGSSGAAAISGYTATITAPTKVTIGKIYVNTPDNDDACTVNGVTFTKKAAKDDDENEFTSVAELVAQINAAGLGLTAAVTDTNYATIISTVPGAVAITLTTTDATKLAISSEEAVAYVEVTESAGKRWLAAKVTTDATITVGVTLIRGLARRLPVTQVVAASYPA
jgi:hypothetical protein